MVRGMVRCAFCCYSCCCCSCWRRGSYFPQSLQARPGGRWSSRVSGLLHAHATPTHAHASPSYLPAGATPTVTYSCGRDSAHAHATRVGGSPLLLSHARPSAYQQVCGCAPQHRFPTPTPQHQSPAPVGGKSPVGSTCAAGAGRREVLDVSGEESSDDGSPEGVAEGRDANAALKSYHTFGRKIRKILFKWSGPLEETGSAETSFGLPGAAPALGDHLPKEELPAGEATPDATRLQGAASDLQASEARARPECTAGHGTAGTAAAKRGEEAPSSRDDSNLSQISRHPGGEGDATLICRSQGPPVVRSRTVTHHEAPPDAVDGRRGVPVAREDVEGAGEVACRGQRRGSGGSVASEGGGVKRVNRVVSSTLTHWRRLQGSVGSLTNALRHRYHQRIFRRDDRSPPGGVTGRFAGLPGQEESLARHHATHRFSTGTLSAADDGKALNARQDRECRGQGVVTDARPSWDAPQCESCEQSVDSLLTSEDIVVCGGEETSVGDIRESLSVCTSPIGISSPSTSSGTTSSDDAGDSSTGTVIFRAPALKAVDDDVSQDQISVMDADGNLLGEALLTETPARTGGEEASGVATVPDVNERQKNRRMWRRGSEGLVIDGEPVAKRPSLAEQGDLPRPQLSPPTPAEPPSSPRAALSVTRKLFCEAMMAGERGPAPMDEGDEDEAGSPLDGGALTEESEGRVPGGDDGEDDRRSRGDGDAADDEGGLAHGDGVSQSPSCDTLTVFPASTTTGIVSSNGASEASETGEEPRDGRDGNADDGEARATEGDSSADLVHAPDQTMVTAARPTQEGVVTPSGDLRRGQQEEVVTPSDDRQGQEGPVMTPSDDLDENLHTSGGTQSVCDASYDRWMTSSDDHDSVASDDLCRGEMSDDIDLIQEEVASTSFIRDDIDQEELAGVMPVISDDPKLGGADGGVGVPTPTTGPKILITAATRVVGRDTPMPPTIVLDSASAASGWGGSLEGATFPAHGDAHGASSSNTLAAHLAAHPRPPTPKSPITVDEWVATLPPPTSVEDETEAWGGIYMGGEDIAEDMLNLGAEAGLMCGSGPSVTSAGAIQLTQADASVTATAPSAGAAAAVVSTPMVSQPVGSLSATEDAVSSATSSRLHHLKLQDGTTEIAVRPLTLNDVANSFQHQQPQEQEQQADRMDVEGRRSQFAALREKQSSFQSELSGLSFQSKSSIDSLLESRQADPVEVLLSLGFGGQPQDGISRIPERFLKPSQVPGNDIDEFMRSEDELSEMMETAEMMPGIDPLALRRSSVATVSPLMSQLLENIRESRSRQAHGNGSEESVRTPPAPTGIKRFAAVAKKAAVKSTVMNTLVAAGRPNRLSSVLNPENRRLLDLQGQKSPEVPRRRLIIGQASFDLGRDGQLLNDEDEPKEEGIAVIQDHQCAQEEEEEDKHRTSGEHNQEEVDEHIYRHAPLQHKESVWSMASSATSIDSSEEELRDKRLRLQLSLTRRPPQPDGPETPTTPGDSLDSPQLTCGVADSAERRRKLLKRLSSNKRISTVSSSSSREVDELIPEEDLEDDDSFEPAHHQMISEGDASLHSSSDTGNSLHSSTQQQCTHSCQILSNEIQTQNSVQRSFPATRCIHDCGQNVLVQVSTQHSYHPLQRMLPCSSCSPDSGVQHANMFSSSVAVMEKSIESAKSHPVTRSASAGAVRSLPTQRCTTGLRRQQHVDDCCLDVNGQSPSTLQLPWPHPLQNCQHNSAMDQARDGVHEGFQDENGRLGATGPLCRSGSAQSDSSGFMEGDAAEGEARVPSLHPSSLSSAHPSATAVQTHGHSWWWSRESGCSVDTVRHVPFNRTLALRSGHSLQSQAYHRTLSLDQTPTRQDHNTGVQGGHAPGFISPHVCQVHDMSQHLDHTQNTSLMTSSPLPNCHSHSHLTHNVDCPSSSCSHNANPTTLYPSHSLDSPSAFHAYDMKNALHQSPANEQHASLCLQCLPSSTEPAGSLHNSYHSPNSWYRQYALRQQQVSHSAQKFRRRRHSLPEPLPPSRVAEVIPPYHTHKFSHQSSQTQSSQSQMSWQLPKSSWPLQPQRLPLAQWQPDTSEYLFPSTNSNSLASTHFPGVGRAEDGKPEDIASNQQANQIWQPQSPSHELLSTLQSYRQQFVQQEQLSNQLHKIATDATTSLATTQQLYLQLRNISAIRAAIRAEVTHMEQLIAGDKPNSLSNACVSNVVAQMMCLLQQQSELCHDLETLTLASRQPSPEPSGNSTNSQDLPLSHSLSPSQSFMLENVNPQGPLRGNVTSPEQPKPSAASPTSENQYSILPSAQTPVIPGYLEQNANMLGSPSQSVTVQDIKVPVKLSSLVSGKQKPCNNDTPALEKNPVGRHSLSLDSSSYPDNFRSSRRNTHHTVISFKDEGQVEGRKLSLPSMPVSVAGDAYSTQPSDITGQVAQLVKEEVLSQTEALHEQLHQQTKDMADMKNMMHLLLTKLK